VNEKGRCTEGRLVPHFQLPCRVDGTSTDEAGFCHRLDEYYAACGWDTLTGGPQAAQLRDHELSDTVR
jgi:hypothetical protein